MPAKSLTFAFICAIIVCVNSKMGFFELSFVKMREVNAKAGIFELSFVKMREVNAK